MPFGFDSITLSERRLTTEGYLIAPATITRSGVYTYEARELGLKHLQPRLKVKVYKPPAEMSRVAATLDGMPITLNHPPGNVVDAANWRRFAIGEVRDVQPSAGDVVQAALVVRAKQAVEVISQGANHVSLGYTFDLETRSQGAPGRDDYEYAQVNIRPNHVAVVAEGRCGATCSIGDCDSNQPKEKTMRVTVDGIELEVSDAAALAINRLQSENASLRNQGRDFQQGVSEHSSVLRTIGDSMPQLHTDGLSTHQLRTAALREWSKRDRQVAENLRVIFQGRDIDSASHEEVRIAFDSVAAFQLANQNRPIAATDVAIAAALSGSNGRIAFGGISTQELFSLAVRDAWKQPINNDLPRPTTIAPVGSGVNLFDLAAKMPASR